MRPTPSVNPPSAKPNPPLATPGPRRPSSEGRVPGESSRGRLDDRVALVTGGDGGIGRAVCLAFGSEGATVAINHLDNDEGARETRRSVERLGRSAHAISADVGEENGCRELVERTVDEFGRIDILVNNEILRPVPVERFEDLDGDRVERTFRRNVLSVFHLVRYALPYMRQGSVVINVVSTQVSRPLPAILDYAATEGAIVTFTKGLALELGPRGIRVNCVALGPAEPAELAPVFVFLASRESSYLNGEVLGVAGSSFA
jgi:NAD(P)-dependent dehydrogenase (short-subunit alcohol dehydrogenase family)